jgi:hypothetical protein
MAEGAVDCARQSWLYVNAAALGMHARQRNGRRVRLHSALSSWACAFSAQLVHSAESGLQ